MEIRKQFYDQVYLVIIIICVLSNFVNSYVLQLFTLIETYTDKAPI